MTDTVKQHFDTANDLIEYIKNTPVDNSWGNQRASMGSDSGFLGTNTIEQAYNLALKGWPEGLSRISKDMSMINIGGRSKVQKYDVAGDYPIIARAIAGAPDSMTRRVSGHNRKRPVIDLLINIGANGGIQKYVIENRGVAIASVIDELESLGYSVGLKVLSHVNARSAGIRTMTLTLKNAGESIDLEKLIFFMAHAAFLRRLCFAQRETTCTIELERQNYGSTEDVESWSEEIYFPSNHNMNKDCANLELAIQHVKNIVRSVYPDIFDIAA